MIALYAVYGNFFQCRTAVECRTARIITAYAQRNTRDRIGNFDFFQRLTVLECVRFDKLNGQSVILFRNSNVRRILHTCFVLRYGICRFVVDQLIFEYFDPSRIQGNRLGVRPRTNTLTVLIRIRKALTIRFCIPTAEYLRRILRRCNGKSIIRTKSHLRGLFFHDTVQAYVERYFIFLTKPLRIKRGICFCGIIYVFVLRAVFSLRIPAFEIIAVQRSRRQIIHRIAVCFVNGSNFFAAKRVKGDFVCRYRHRNPIGSFSVCVIIANANRVFARFRQRNRSRGARFYNVHFRAVVYLNRIMIRNENRTPGYNALFVGQLRTHRGQIDYELVGIYGSNACVVYNLNAYRIGILSVNVCRFGEYQSVGRRVKFFVADLYNVFRRAYYFVPSNLRAVERQILRRRKGYFVVLYRSRVGRVVICCNRIYLDYHFARVILQRVRGISAYVDRFYVIAFYDFYNVRGRVGNSVPRNACRCVVYLHFADGSQISRINVFRGNGRYVAVSYRFNDKLNARFCHRAVVKVIRRRIAVVYGMYVVGISANNRYQILFSICNRVELQRSKSFYVERGYLVKSLVLIINGRSRSVCANLDHVIACRFIHKIIRERREGNHILHYFAVRIGNFYRVLRYFASRNPSNFITFYVNCRSFAYPNRIQLRGFTQLHAVFIFIRKFIRVVVMAHPPTSERCAFLFRGRKEI